jgi:hypothetical protein
LGYELLIKYTHQTLWQDIKLRLSATNGPTKFSTWFANIESKALNFDGENKRYALVCTTPNMHGKVSATLTQFKNDVEKIAGEYLELPCIWQLSSTQEYVATPTKPTEILEIVDVTERLPSLSNSDVGIPNAMVRGALFGISNKSEWVKDKQLTTVAGYDLSYSGDTLDQGDLDVLIAALRFSSAKEFGEVTQVSTYQILKEMGLSTGKENYVMLEKRIDRLFLARIKLESKDLIYSGGLISSFTKVKDTNLYSISFDKKMAPLLTNNQYSRIDINIRAQLNGNALAQWLHAFYSTHATPAPYKVDTIHTLCGSKTLDVRFFKPKLKSALELISKVYASNNKHFEFEINNDVVYVKKSGTKAQSRHIVKKIIDSKPTPSKKPPTGLKKLTFG